MVEARICVVITADEPVKAVEAIREVHSQGPDLIELRLDYMENPGGLKSIREATDLPLIATNRSREQGGHSDLPEEERLGVLLAACDAGFEYVDVEATTEGTFSFVKEAKERGSEVIISHHDFDGTPSRDQLEALMTCELTNGADVCKIIGTAREPSDCLAYLSFLNDNRGVRLVCFGMGGPGAMSRIFSPVFGGEFTYASSAVGAESAPGQLTIRDMREIYRVLGI